MENRNITRLFITLLGLAFVFTSCDNFLNGQDTKKQLEKAIAYANSDAYTVMVDYPEGTGVLKSPAGGLAEIKETDTFAITFEPFTDYAFVCWKIIDSVTGKELPNGEYLTIEKTEKADTKCTFNTKPADDVKLAINAVVAERPQIISYSPSSTDIMRDCSILVLFDRDMDPYSIYYTEQEIADLQKDTGITLLSTTLNDGSSVVYGYSKDGNVVFKNISITNKKTKENLTGYYDAPTMEDGLLTIPANRSNPPKGYSQILVTLAKGFYYTLEDSNETNANGVELAGSKKWMYQVNNSTDTQKMKPKKDANSNDIFTVKLGSEQLHETYFNNNFQAEENDTLHIKKSNLKALQPNVYNMFFTDKNMDVSKIYLKMSLEDGMGSGPKPNFNVKLQKVANADYTLNPESNSTIFETITDYLNVSAQEAFFEGEFALGNLVKEDGVYLLTVTCEDKSNNALVKEYLFAKDTKRPTNRGIEKIIIIKNQWNDTISYGYAWKKEDYDIDIISFYYEHYENENHVMDVHHDYNSSAIKKVLLDGDEYYMSYIGYYNGVTTYDCWIEYTECSGEIVASEKTTLKKDAISQYIPLGQNKKYIFGNYPKSKCILTSEQQENMKAIDIYDLATPEDLSKSNPNYAIWHSDWYLGPDGYFYEKYNNNYYKIEPIEWFNYSTDPSSFLGTKIIDVGPYTDHPLDVSKVFTQLGRSVIQTGTEINNLSIGDANTYFSNNIQYSNLTRFYTAYSAAVATEIFELETDEITSDNWWMAEQRYVLYYGQVNGEVAPANREMGYVPQLYLNIHP